jgi:ABC-2 type transport system ATP-binding protein
MSTPGESSPVGPAVETIGLGRDYGGTRALDALDMAIAPGSIVGVLGPNGAGKTTALLLLATLLTPSRGTARVLGHDTVRERTAIRRHLGLLFQETSLDGLLTVEENLRFAARLAGLGGAAARRAIAEAIERTGLSAYASRRASELSGGWRRLTDIARATLHRPAMLILDEPTVGLDPEHRDRVWTFIERERRERGTTVLFSTHYLAEAEPADRVILLAGGVVVADDSPGGLMESIGTTVIEVEGPDAPALVSTLRHRMHCVTVIQTERGYRIGLTDSGGPLPALAEYRSRSTRLVMRPATLEDVYFARTQPQRGQERLA